MADPLDVLRQPIVPLLPRAQFASELRARIHRELRPPSGGQMSTVTSVTTVVTPYLTVSNAAEALRFYAEAFGAVEDPDHRYDMPDGRVGHAEFRIGEAAFYLSDEYHELGVDSPRTLGGTSFAIHLVVPNVDALFERAVAAGSTALMPVEDQPYGLRSGVVVDPYGHRWMIATPIGTPVSTPVSTPAGRSTGEAPAPRGELFYYTWKVRDLERAKDFFGQVLGWEYAPATLDGVTITNTVPPMGLRSGGDREITMSLRVPDLRSALAKVRELGGEADEPAESAYGWWASCRDPDGFEFSLSEPPPDY